MEGDRKPPRRFFLYRPVTFTPTGLKKTGVKLVTMEEGMDFIMRPVLRGCCSYESLVDGTLTMVDLARMNDALDVMDENERRLNKEDK
jgi:uncharacterized protein DUF6889